MALMFFKFKWLFFTGISVITSFSAPRAFRARESEGESKIKRKPKDIRQPGEERLRSLPGPRAPPPRPPRPTSPKFDNSETKARGRGRGAKRVALYTVINQYAEVMRTRLEAERVEELRVASERLKTWPMERLEAEGILISDLHAEVFSNL